tara:strand:+ start:924 stop:1319 length:396 start_codon:yes stop_codon:yes gene_type:complete
MKGYKLFLDDVRVPYDVFNMIINPIYENNEDWDIVKDYNSFISYIKENGIPKFISYDHDLSFDHYLGENQEGDIDYDNMEEKTGYDCAKWLVQYCLESNLTIPDYYVHSANPVGKKNIEMYLENAKKHYGL